MLSSGSILMLLGNSYHQCGSQQQGNYSLSIVVVVHCPSNQCVVVVQCRTPFQLWWVLFLWNIGATPILHLIHSLSAILEHDLHLMIFSVECSIQPLDSLVSIQPPAIHSRPPLPQGISSLFKDTVFPRKCRWNRLGSCRTVINLHKQVPYILCLLNLFCQAFIHLSWATKKCNNNKSKFQTVLSHLQ